MNKILVILLMLAMMSQSKAGFCSKNFGEFWQKVTFQKRWHKKQTEGVTALKKTLDDELAEQSKTGRFNFNKIAKKSFQCLRRNPQFLVPLGNYMGVNLLTFLGIYYYTMSANGEKIESACAFIDGAEDVDKTSVEYLEAKKMCNKKYLAFPYLVNSLVWNVFMYEGICKGATSGVGNEDLSKLTYKEFQKRMWSKENSKNRLKWALGFSTSYMAINAGYTHYMESENPYHWEEIQKSFFSFESLGHRANDFLSAFLWELVTLPLAYNTVVDYLRLNLLVNGRNAIIQSLKTGSVTTARQNGKSVVRNIFHSLRNTKFNNLAAEGLGRFFEFAAQGAIRLGEWGLVNKYLSYWAENKRPQILGAFAPLGHKPVANIDKKVPFKVKLITLAEAERIILESTADPGFQVEGGAAPDQLNFYFVQDTALEFPSVLAF